MKNKTSTKRLFQQLFSMILLISLLSGTFSVSAQTRRVRSGGQVAPKKPVAEKEKEVCADCWSGTITYRKFMEEEISENDPVFGTLDPKSERIVKNNSRNYEYAGSIVVDGSSGQAITSAKVSYEYGETQKASQTEWTRCHNFEKDRLVTETSETGGNAKAEGQGEAELFNFQADGNKFHFGARFPDAHGKYSEKNTITRKNFCPNSTRPPTETYEKSRDEKVIGETVSIEDKVNPASPNEITGTKTWKEKLTPNSTITYIAKWKFRRKALPLMITEVKFFQLQYPSPNCWTEIEYNDHTIDGNEVKIVATIVNLSGEQKSAAVNFKELNENINLPEGNIPVDFKPHEERRVEYIWDTSGFAWKESRPYNESDIFRRVEVRIPDDYEIGEVEVDPKPVVLIPGMWTNPRKFADFAAFFKMHNTPWMVVVSPVYVKKTGAANAPVIDKTVRAVQEKENAWHIDLVAHSTGGLMARAYVDSEMPTQYDNRPTAAHLVMLGTPNLGTPCASGVDNIITKIFNRQPEAFGEISHNNMRAFNETITKRHGTKFLAIVTNTISPTCQLDEAGDGIVPFISAVYTSKTYVVTNVSHEDLGGDQTVFTQVRAWLAVSPKGNHAPDNSMASNGSRINEYPAGLREENFGRPANGGVMFIGANYQRKTTEDLLSGDTIDTDGDDPEPNYATGIKLAANQSTEIEIPVTGGSKLSLVLIAPPNVSATLIDDKGEIVGKNLAGTPEAGAVFRLITIKKPFQSGNWKLKLENREQTESEIIVTAYIDYQSKTFKAVQNAKRKAQSSSGKNQSEG